MRLRAFGMLLALPVVAQAQITVSLSKPDAQFPDPFTRIAGVREMANGKVLVSDIQDKVVQMIDFAAGHSMKVSREGQGPTEYAIPTSLYGMPKGETWVNDILGRRFLVIDATGKAVRTVALPSASGGGGGFVSMSIGGGGADQTGHIYFQSPPFSAAGPGAPPPDSLAITRWDGVKPSMDTVAWMVPAKNNFSGSGSGGRVLMRIGGAKVFTPAEQWGVAADGAIARVMYSPYRVVWYQPSGGTMAVGPAQAYTPIAVTDADKKEIIEQRKRQRPMTIMIGGPPGGRAAAPPNIQLPDPEFADTKPPFDGNNAVVVSPEGEVWVQRTQPAGAKNPLYDVFDRTGRLVRKMTLNPRSVVRGFGKGTVYVVRTDDDDLQYVERYKR